MSRGATLSTPPPTTNIDFTGVSVIGDLPAGSTFTRASGATRVNQRGYLEEVAANALRPTYDPALQYNLVPNPWSAGAPDGWLVSSSGGVTVTFLSTGIRNGIPYSRYRFAGTASASGALVFWAVASVSSPYNIPIPPGGDVRGEYYLEVARLGAGHTPTTFSGAYRTYDSAGGAVTNNTYTPAATNTRTFADGPIRTVIASAANAYMVRPQLAPTIAAASVVDIDIDIGFPVVSVGAYLTDSVPVATLAARKGSVPQYGTQGLLLEEAATNAITNARDLAPWTGTGTTTAASVAAAPNGALEATRVAEVAATTTHFSQGATPGTTVIGEVWTFSMFVKAETITLAQLVMANAAFGLTAYANFDLANGVLGTVGATATASMVRHSNGWWRINITSTSTAAAGPTVTLGLIPTANAARLPAYAGAVTQTLLCWGAQMEKQPFPTSVVLPPVGTPAASTRARDEFLLPGSAITSMAQGSLAVRYATARFGGTGNLPAIGYVFNIGTSTERVGMFVFSGNSNAGWGSATALPNQGSIAMGVGSNDVPLSTALAWGGGNAYAAASGAAVINDTTWDSPTPALPTVFRVNGRWTPPNGANMVIQYLRIWDGTKLTAQQVQQQSARTS